MSERTHPASPRITPGSPNAPEPITAPSSPAAPPPNCPPTAAPTAAPSAARYDTRISAAPTLRAAYDRIGFFPPVRFE